MRAFTSELNLRRVQLHRDLALLVLVTVGCALPFLAQPFHMDDNFYMDMARGVFANPVHPYDRPYDFGGFHLPDMASHSHPPLQAYFLAGIQRLAGEGEGREWIYHSVSLIFPVLAVVSLYFIAALFVERPIWPALALAVCPVFLVLQHTLMTDVPTLAYWLAAVALFLWASETDRKSLFLGSSFFQFAAMFTSYQAVALAPLLGFYQLRRRGRRSGWIALALPPALIIFWLLISYAHYGRMVLIDTVGYIQSRSSLSPGVLGTKVIALLEYQGWLILFPTFLLYILARGLKGRLFVLALLISAFIAQAVLPAGQYRLLDKAVFVIGFVTGLCVVLRTVAMARPAFSRNALDESGFGRTETQFLALWYLGVTAYCLFLLTEGSARYILPLVPPFLIFFFRKLEMRETSEYRAERAPLMNSAMVASGSIVLSLAWALFLAQADFELARIYPRAAAAFARMANGLDSHIAGEWGFRYYFGRIGAGPLPADESAVRGGSLLVTPKLAMPYPAPAALSSMAIPFAALSFELKTPFRTMDWSTPAGFYSTGWGLTPFSLSWNSLEILSVQQVSFLVERLPWARVDSATGVMPWPGFVPGQERILALLAKPGTRISYPWTLRRPVSLSVELAVLNDGAAAADGAFRFEILRRDALGQILARFERTLTAGGRTGAGDRLAARIDLPASAGDGDTLELRYTALGQGSATGAFAQAVFASEGSRP